MAWFEGKQWEKAWEKLGSDRVWIWMPLMNTYQGTWTSFWCSVIVEVIWAGGVLEAGQEKATLLWMYTMCLWGISQRSYSGGVTETSRSLNESNLSGNGRKVGVRCKGRWSGKSDFQALVVWSQCQNFWTQGICWLSRGKDSVLPLQRAWVWLLMRKLRSLNPQGDGQKKKKKELQDSHKRINF